MICSFCGINTTEAVMTYKNFSTSPLQLGSLLSTFIRFEQRLHGVKAAGNKEIVHVELERSAFNDD